MAPTPDDFAEQIDSRKKLMPDEEALGSDDPAAQAATILEESESRTLDPERSRHESSQTPNDNRPGGS